MAQKQKTVSARMACEFIDEYASNHDGTLYGDHPPQELKEWIVRGAHDDVITYNKISHLISKASTAKMYGSANRGLEWLRAKLKQNYIGEI